MTFLLFFFFFFGNEILFSDSLKIFVLSGRRSSTFIGQIARPQGMFWRHLTEFHSNSNCSKESHRHNLQGAEEEGVRECTKRTKLF